MKIKTKKTDSRATPQWLLGMFEDWFDPCPLNPNPEIDGLKIDWEDKTYVNPPYSNGNIQRWVNKAINEAKKGKRIVMLLPADTSTKYHLDLISAGARIFFSHGRISFIGYDMPAWGSMLVFLNFKDKNSESGK